MPIKSSDRTLALLHMLASSPGGLAHARIAAQLRVPKSSLTQLLSSLRASGYVDLDADRGRYRLGPAAGRLAQEVLDARPGPDAWDARVQASVTLIAEATGEGASYCVLEGGRVKRTHAAQSVHALAYRMQPGASFALHTTSAGKLALAGWPEARLRRYFAKAVAAPTPRSLTRFDAMQEELARVRRAGVAYSVEEQTPGVVAIAVAAHAPGGRWGALNVAMPRLRFKPAFRGLCIDTLREAAARLAAPR